MDKKDKKSDKLAGLRPPTVKTVVGVASLPNYPALDLDMEELSGSLLVEEPPGRGPLIVATPAPSVGPAPASPPGPPASSAPPSGPASPPGSVPAPAGEPALAPAASLSPSRRPRAIPPPPKLDPGARPHPPPAPPAVSGPPPWTAGASGAPQPPPAPASGSPLPAAVGDEPPGPTWPATDDIELTTLPRSKLAPIVTALKRILPAGAVPTPAIARASGKSWPLPLVAAAGLLVGVGLVAIVVAAARRDTGPSRALAPAPVAATPATTGLAAHPAPPTATGSAPAATAATALACTVAGPHRVIAPNALLAAGIEVRAFGDDVAVGFATSEHQAMLVRLEPSSLAVSESSVSRSAEPVRRATPVPGKKGHLDLAVDVDRASDPLQGRRTMPLDPPLQIGAAEWQLAWAPPGHRVAAPLWPLDGDGKIEALRGARSETDLSSLAIAFRRAGAVWVGAADLREGLVPRGGLWRLGGAGPNVGFPALAYSDGVVVVAWADRATSDEPWSLRWVRFKAGEAPGDARAFTPPPGGKGEQAMSPGLAVVPGGGFLLVWTEGPPSGHAVRALTLSADGAAVGDPLNISNDRANAGQGQAAIAAHGRGVVAFLESSPGGFQVVATPITCGR